VEGIKETGNNQVILEEESPLNVPSIGEFRRYVDEHCGLWHLREAIFVKLTYLLGARESELLTRVTPYQLSHGKTKAYGTLLGYGLSNYKRTDGKTVKLLLVKSAIAKRRKQDKTTTEDGVFKVRMKTVPIVCDNAVEPWAVDILKWLANVKESQGKLSFDFVGMTAQNIVKRCLNELDPTIHPHSLRHYRITHLIRGYGFSPYQITAFTGWSIQSTFGSMGMRASSNIDIYAHLSWHDYIEKMLVPLSEAA
jgi:integrase